jgi:uncharacterized damage-inducible protein DinB
MDPPRNPAGEFVEEENCDRARLTALIREIEQAPMHLRRVISDLSASRLDTKYRNWSIRQIVHHLADSHVNSYIRCKWTLTEDMPTIKAYFEDRWVTLSDSRDGVIEPALVLFDAIHTRWVQLLRALSSSDFARAFVHPETGQTMRLDTLLSYYSWHSRHHTAQIAWLREQHGW